MRNRRLLLCLHTIFRALIYWAHRAVVLAIAWHLVFSKQRPSKQTASVSYLSSSAEPVSTSYVNGGSMASRAFSSESAGSTVIMLYEGFGRPDSLLTVALHKSLLLTFFV